MDHATETALTAAARAVRRRAYAPYSGFAVGAALLGSDGEIHAGCNVENASYGLGVCAERHAVAAAVAAGATPPAALVVASEIDPPAAPCGACRQVLAEFGDFPVVLVGAGGSRRETSVAELLPLAFGPSDLARPRSDRDPP